MRNSPEIPGAPGVGHAGRNAQPERRGAECDYTHGVWGCPTRRAVWGLCVGLGAAAILLTVDRPTAEFMQRFGEGGRWELGGDLQRALAFLQQFGDLLSSILVGLVILLLDPARRSRLLDWAAGGAATALASWLLKMMIGRARPRLGDPLLFLGPTREWTFTVQDAHATSETITTHAMRLSGRGVSDLWSMPSSHASASAAFAVAMVWMYPKLKPLGVGLVLVVGVTRLVFGAHYASDVALGAGLGFAITTLAMGRSWGSRFAGVFARRENRPLQG